MRSKLTSFFVTVTFLALSTVCFPASEEPLLYVANSRDNTVSLISLVSFKLIGDIRVGDHVHGVTISSDGKKMFTTSEVDRTLVTSDSESHKIIGTVKVPGKPNQIAVTPDGHYVTVPLRDSDGVAIVDVQQQKLVKVLPLNEPHNSLNTGSNRYMFVSSMGSNEVAVIDFEKMDFSDHIPVGGRPRPFVISKDGKTMYVALANLHGFNIVNIADKKVIQRVKIPSEHPGPPRPRDFETPDTESHGLVLSADESEVWVTSMLDNSIYIYDLQSNKVAGQVKVGDGPNWVVLSPDGKLVCVSNTGSEDVSIINAKERREVARVKVGKAPKRIAVAAMIQQH